MNRAGGATEFGGGDSPAETATAPKELDSRWKIALRLQERMRDSPGGSLAAAEGGEQLPAVRTDLHRPVMLR